MNHNVFRFRSVKWGDPEQKLKMLADDIGRPRWHSWLVRYWEYGAVVMAFIASFVVGSFLF
jgi:hypothetical protein